MFTFLRRKIPSLCKHTESYTAFTGTCAISSRAIGAAVSLEDWGALTAALIWLLIYPLGWYAGVCSANSQEQCTPLRFLFVGYQVFVVLPAQNAAVYDPVTKEWKSESTDYTSKYGDIFTSYRGVRMAQIFVMLTTSVMLINGLCTGLLYGDELATLQAWLMTVMACALFGALILHRPTVDPSFCMTIRLQQHHPSTSIY
jgi:hypothetical protein